MCVVAPVAVCRASGEREGSAPRLASRSETARVASIAEPGSFRARAPPGPSARTRAVASQVVEAQLRFPLQHADRGLATPRERAAVHGGGGKGRRSAVEAPGEAPHRGCPHREPACGRREEYRGRCSGRAGEEGRAGHEVRRRRRRVGHERRVHKRWPKAHHWRDERGCGGRERVRAPRYRGRAPPLCLERLHRRGRHTQPGAVGGMRRAAGSETAPHTRSGSRWMDVLSAARQASRTRSFLWFLRPERRRSGRGDANEGGGPRPSDSRANRQRPQRSPTEEQKPVDLSGFTAQDIQGSE